MQTPEVGHIWASQVCLNQKFKVLSGPELHNGLGEWSKERFVGFKAERIPDGLPALVGLIKKPSSYGFDFVLL